MDDFKEALVSFFTFLLVALYVLMVLFPIGVCLVLGIVFLSKGMALYGWLLVASFVIQIIHNIVLGE